MHLEEERLKNQIDTCYLMHLLIIASVLNFFIPSEICIQHAKFYYCVQLDSSKKRDF